MEITEGNNQSEELNNGYPKFLFFLSGQLISLLGSSIAGFAIIYWITIKTQSAWYLGLSAFLGFGSTMVVIPFAGVFVDRWSRRALIATVDSLEAISTVAIIWLFYLGNVQIWHILVLLTLRGIFQGFHDPAIQAIIPVLVPQEKLKSINGLQYLSTGLITLVGPLIGAGLITLVGVDNTGAVLWIDAGTFVVAVIPLLIISIPNVRKNEGEKPKFSDELKEGVTYIRETKGLLSLLSAFTTSNFFAIPSFILLPLVIVAPLLINGDQNLLGMAMFGQALGTILGSIMISKFNIFKNNAKGVFIALLFMYFANFLLAIGAVLQSFLTVFLAVMISGFMLPIANVSSQTIWQTVVPLELQGRVYAVRRFIAQFLTPAAMLLSGIFGDILGLVNVINISTFFGLVILLCLWFLTGLPYVEETLAKIAKQNAEPISTATS